MIRLPLRVPALAVATLLAGCTVGPTFERPAAPGDVGYRAPGEIRPATGAPAMAIGDGPTLRWWTAFGSPRLDALVDRAIAHNQTLAASNATLAAAREQVVAIRGRQLPQVDATARIEHETVNLSAFGFPGSNPEFSLYSVGGGISYDLDLFGGTRRRVEQAAAQAETQLHQTQAAHLTVAGQVVNQVLTIAAIRAQIATAEALLADDRRNVDLTQKRKDAGEGTLVEVLTAQSQFEADRADIPQLSQQSSEAHHLLATLVGVAPADLTDADFDFADLTLPAAVPVTLPSALVHKRPDILQAEASFHAATAAVGIATAALYPDITLGATVTQGAPNIGDIVSSAFRGFDLFGGVSAPIFHGGTLKAERRAAIARASAAQATYQQTVLDAFRQVADLLQSIDSDQRSVANQRESVDVARRSVGLSRRSFQVGNTGILQILDSERLYQRAAANLVDAQARQFLDVARLYVATAGGWTGDAARPDSETASAVR